MTQHIAIYGRGGVGKSTLASNLAAALAEIGQKVVLVGCDPQGDSTSLLHVEGPRPTVIELIAETARPILDDLVTRGYRNIACIEVGDPFLIGECAASGIGRAITLLRDLDAFGRLAPDVVLYDIPGEAGCLGSAVVSQARIAFIVTSADIISLSAANSLLRIVGQGRGGVPLAGALIANGLTGSFEESLVDDFAGRVNSRVIGSIPRSLVVRQCEMYEKTVIEAAPLSNHAYHYRRLARQVVDDRVISALPVPRPLSPGELKVWARSWGDRLYELEHGVIRDGAGI